VADFSGGGSGGSSGAVALLASSLLAATAASLDFPAIPQTSTHLRLLVNAGCDNVGGAGIAQIRINNDSTALYDTLGNVLLGTGTATFAVGVAATAARIGALPYTGLALASAPIEILIPDYTRTTFYRTWAGFGGRKDANAQANFNIEGAWGSYRSQLAITQVTVLARGQAGTAQNFVPGSGAWLYGIT
jgi:hypothetical protein